MGVKSLTGAYPRFKNSPDFLYPRGAFFWRAGPIRFSPFRLPQSEKIVVPEVLYGLMAAGTDVCDRELSRKTLGQSDVPATVSVSTWALD